LVTVKTYPKPSSKYDELVCTAGLLEGDKWIRIYPVPFRFLTNNQQYPKYSWVIINVVRNTKDFRPESYRPTLGLDEEFIVEKSIGTKDAWAARKSFILKEVFENMSELIELAKGEQCKSLATIKPKEITRFEIEETSREWKESWREYYLQTSFLDLTVTGGAKQRAPIRKVPYNYYYKFLTEGDNSPRKLKIEDWEIGALFWNCLERTDGDEESANELVRKKYYDEFVKKKDLYLFVGTTLEHHKKRARNPFMIIGVFYPPKSDQPLLV
jgi:hypothetical protein